MISESSFFKELERWSNMPEFKQLELKLIYEISGSKLLIAFLVGDLDLVKQIYKSGEEEIDGRNLKGECENLSYLFAAINHIEVFKFLYKKGIRFNRNETALHIVCCVKNRSTAYLLTEFLIEKGYKVSAKDAYGKNVFEDYLRQNYNEVIWRESDSLFNLLAARLIIENETSFNDPQDIVNFLQKIMPSKTLTLENIIHILEKAGSPIAYMTAGLILANFIEIQDSSSVNQTNNYYEKRLHDAITFIEKAGQHLDWKDDAFHYLFEIRAIYGESFQSITDRLGCYPLQSSAETSKCFKQTEVSAPIPYFIFWNQYPNENVQPKNLMVIQLSDDEAAESKYECQ